MNFAQLRNEGIRDDVLVGVNSLGFIETTPVQEKVIPLLLSGKDVLVQAPTGTGKTAACHPSRCRYHQEFRLGGYRCHDESV